MGEVEPDGGGGEGEDEAEGDEEVAAGDAGATYVGRGVGDLGGAAADEGAHVGLKGVEDGGDRVLFRWAGGGGVFAAHTG